MRRFPALPRAGQASPPRCHRLRSRSGNVRTRACSARKARASGRESASPSTDDQTCSPQDRHTPCRPRRPPSRWCRTLIERPQRVQPASPAPRLKYSLDHAAARFRIAAGRTSSPTSRAKHGLRRSYAADAGEHAPQRKTIACSSRRICSRRAPQPEHQTRVSPHPPPGSVSSSSRSKARPRLIRIDTASSETP